MSTDVVITNSDLIVLETVSQPVVIETVSQPVVIEQLAEGPQGPPGPPGPVGPAGSGVGPPVRVTVPSGDTLVIEEFDSAVYRTIKWIVTITNPILETVRTFELLALNNNTHCSHTIYGSIGDQILCFTDVQLINNKITLLVTNSESNELIVDAIRISSIPI